MVRLHVILGISLFAAQALGQWKCNTQEECDEQCRKNRGADACTTRLANGDCNGCCTGNGKQYRDPDTGNLKCCDNADTEWMVDKKNKDKGSCCPSGDDPKHAYFWNAKTGTGSCCPADSTGYDGKECVQVEPGPDPDPDEPKGCSKKVCPEGKDDLGLEYGKCYMFKNPDGETLAKNAKHPDYIWGGVNGGHWHFRVCKNTKDCSHAGPVGKDEEFVLNDVIGAWDKASDKPWWMCKSGHYKTCNDERFAKKLKAVAWCADDCGICLKGLDSGIGPVCPVPKGGGIGDNGNPNICTPVTVWEVPCMYPDPVEEDKEKDKEEEKKDENKDKEEL